MASADEIVRAATHAAFGKPLVVNVLRSMLVEAMVATALPKPWTWCSTEYASCDFIHADGTRLEVKQSAARQSWSKQPGRVSRCSFDIAARTGFWSEGDTWIARPGRNAEIYVFAHHPVVDDTADHRRPDQWEFYTVPVTALPAAKTISLSGVRLLATVTSFQDLATEIEYAHLQMQTTAGLSDEA